MKSQTSRNSSFRAFSLFPKLIHFFKCHVLQFLAHFLRLRLHVIETVREFPVCLLKGCVRIKVIESRSIDDSEDKVPQLIECLFLIA